ncbi:hypothetical protein [Mycobacteroides abscessus]|uniref:hypothetical protein n=1 Tax=Mycobacteroides abscessus TaxID=36809 RepID=UPI000C265BB1|nr:hypothetical protein [Mycobacteroides abscessus]
MTAGDNNAARVSLRGAILQVLATAPQLLSSSEVARLLPMKTIAVNVSCNTVCAQSETWARRGEITEYVLEHHRNWHLVQTPRTAADITTALIALEKAGAVASIAALGRGEPHWVITPNADDYNSTLMPDYRARPVIDLDVSGTGML